MLCIFGTPSGILFTRANADTQIPVSWKGDRFLCLCAEDLSVFDNVRYWDQLPWYQKRNQHQAILISRRRGDLYLAVWLFYTTIPHQKLKSRLATIIRNSFIHKNGNCRYKFLVLGREGQYFVKEHSDSKNKYTEDDIVNMLEFLVDNIFVVFGGKVF